MPGDRPEEGAAEQVADRLRYAPELVDVERVVEVFATSGPAGRATIAGAVGAASPSLAARLTDLVPLLVETMDGDHDRGAQHFLSALARIAEADPAAVRRVTDRIVEHLTAYNVWENRAAAEAFRHVVTAYPDEIDRIEPLLDHDERRIQDRAASVLAAATERDPTLAVDFLDDSARIADRNSLARASAVDVLANAGWLDPAALDPATEELIGLVRDGGETRRGDATGDGSRGTSSEGEATGTDSGAGEAPAPDSGERESRSDRGEEPPQRGEGPPQRGEGRLPRDARDHEPDDDEDVAATRRAALVALGHLAGHDPGAVQSILPLCVELAANEDEAISEAAARVLVALLLQEPSTSLAGFAGPATYFDRRALVGALADASAGLPARELLFLDFLDDESGFIRFEAYRQIAPDA